MHAILLHLQKVSYEKWKIQNPILSYADCAFQASQLGLSCFHPRDIRAVLVQQQQQYCEGRRSSFITIFVYEYRVVSYSRTTYRYVQMYSTQQYMTEFPHEIWLIFMVNMMMTLSKHLKSLYEVLPAKWNKIDKRKQKSTTRQHAHSTYCCTLPAYSARPV